MLGSRKRIAGVRKKPASSFLVSPTAAQQKLLLQKQQRLIDKGHLARGRDGKLYLTPKGKKFLNRTLRLDTF